MGRPLELRTPDAPLAETAGAAVRVAVVAVLTGLALACVLASATGGSPATLLGETATHGWPAVLWMASAWGWGRLAALGLGPAVRGSRVLPPAIGAAVLLALDSAVFRLSATPAAAWTLTVAGLAALLIRRPAAAGPPAAIPCPRSSLGLLLPGLLPAATLLAAAAAVPGWLWASEFGGYDALSYHLQLPAEWAEAGRARPLQHNVYSFLPNAVEHAFLHVGLLRGDPRAAGPAAHLLHAAMAMAAAATTASLARATARTAGADEPAAGWIGAAAGVLLLATPWTVVCGSLAYCEMAVLWMMAASMRLALAADGPSRPGEAMREGSAHGLLCGAAVAAKLTAGPLAVVPAILWWLLVRRPAATAATVRRLATLAAFAGITGLLVLGPWLLAGWVHAGNPIFPFAAGFLGAGHWTPEQVAAWQAGHGRGAGLPALGAEWLVHGIAGDEPPQWGLLPIAGLLATMTAAAACRGRRRMLLLAPGLILLPAIGLWAGLTHAQSRFLLPTAVPLSIAVAMWPLAACATGAVTPASRGWQAMRFAVVLVIAIQCLWPPLLLIREREGRAGIGIGAGAAVRGIAHERAMDAARRLGDRPLQEAILATAPPTWWVRFGLGPDARVLMIGEAAVLHHDPDRIAYRTVWDRDALTRWLDAAESEESGKSPGGSWADAAVAAGFTHAFVDRIMLENWAARGWNDPRMRWERLLEDAGRTLPVVASFDDGMRLLVSLSPGPVATPVDPSAAAP